MSPGFDLIGCTAAWLALGLVGCMIGFLSLEKMYPVLLVLVSVVIGAFGGPVTLIGAMAFYFWIATVARRDGA